MIRTRIPAKEINYHPASCHDTHGRLFWWDGDLYRGIREESSAFYKKLVDDGIIRKLIEKRYLVETDTIDLALDGYPLVFKHRVVPFVSFAIEWCPEMLRDAALFMIDLTAELVADGLFIDDPEPFNVLFDGCHPVLVDVCSIEPTAHKIFTKWNAYQDEFRNEFIYPLRLLSMGKGSSIRRLLVDYYDGKDIDEQVFPLVGYRRPKKFSSLASRIIPSSMNSATWKVFGIMESTLKKCRKDFFLYKLEVLKQLRQEIDSISVPSMHRKNIVAAENSCELIGLSDRRSKKSCAVQKILSEVRPPTVLNISGNDLSWYSKLAASCGSRVVSIDDDDRNVACCYREAREKNLPILPLVMNFQDPTAEFYIGKNLNSPAFQRLQSDMVMALSKVHTLYFDHNLGFEQIIEMFASFSKKWVLAEFASIIDEGASHQNSNRHALYTLENFNAALQKQFHEVTIIQYSPNPHVLLLCEK